MAAVNAVHADARRGPETDWAQVLELYDQLYAVSASPVVALNRAVALAEVEGATAALAVVDGLGLEGYHPFHATRADLLRRLGRAEDAAGEYRLAIETAGNRAERAFLQGRLDAL
jgi:RNA polymerase sigma-70 factor (ECF subfamily)